MRGLGWTMTKAYHDRVSRNDVVRNDEINAA